MASQMYQSPQQFAPKASPRFCIFMVSATVHNFGEFKPFWVRKRSEISPKLASIGCYLALKWTQICPKWPWNDSHNHPNSILQLWSVVLNIIFRHSGHFWVKKGWILTSNSHNLAKFCPISPPSTSFENYKARQTFLDHFWRPKLPNKTKNLTEKGAILCCRNCILADFTNTVPDNDRS